MSPEKKSSAKDYGGLAGVQASAGDRRPEADCPETNVSRSLRVKARLSGFRSLNKLKPRNKAIKPSKAITFITLIMPSCTHSAASTVTWITSHRRCDKCHRGEVLPALVFLEGMRIYGRQRNRAAGAFSAPLSSRKPTCRQKAHLLASRNTTYVYSGQSVTERKALGFQTSDCVTSADCRAAGAEFR